jgi:radical SAM-linked protein
VKENYLNEIGSREKTEKRGMFKRGTKKKVRLKFTKRGEVRFVSHLELAHLFYRASKRADLPLGYSEGFHPMPRIIFAGALPVGVESLMEVVDLELEGGITPLEVMERLNVMLPQGIEVIASEEVSLSSKPSSLLQQSIYWIPMDHLPPREETSTKIKKALEKRECYIHQERKGKKRIVDVRPLIERMDVRENGKGLEGGHRWGVELVLRNEQGRRAKPSEIIGTILGVEGEPLLQCRIVKLE